MVHVLEVVGFAGRGIICGRGGEVGGWRWEDVFVYQSIVMVFSDFWIKSVKYNVPKGCNS